MKTGMGYEGDELVGTVHPEYARMPPLGSMRKIRAPIFKTINHVHIAHSSTPINIGFSANKTGENNISNMNDLELRQITATIPLFCTKSQLFLGSIKSYNKAGVLHLL